MVHKQVCRTKHGRLVSKVLKNVITTGNYVEVCKRTEITQVCGKLRLFIIKRYQFFQIIFIDAFVMIK